MEGEDERRREYTKERIPWGKGIEELRERNTVTIRIVVVIKLKSYIQELTSSDCADNDSSLDKTILSLLYCHLNPL